MTLYLIILVGITGQGGIVDHLVQFRRDGAFLFLFVVVGFLLDDLIFGLIGLRHDGARPDATVADGLVRIEFVGTFGAVRGAPSQIVKLGLAVRADLLGAQFGICQRRRPSKNACVMRGKAASLATREGGCQSIPARLFPFPGGVFRR